MMVRTLFRVLFLAAAVAAASSAWSEETSAGLRLPRVFGDHMVLQRGVAVPVWGWGTSGSKVTVSVAGRTAFTKCGTNGRWKLTVPPMPPGGPHEMTVESDSKLLLKDVLIGDVWFASGQSNMAWPVSKTVDANKEIAAADLPSVRLLQVQRTTSAVPLDDLTSTTAWTVCSPKTAGVFSAVAYFFGRDLHKHLNVPVGLIHSSWGGTAAEAWTSRGGLQQLPGFAERLKMTPTTTEAWEKAKRTFKDRLQLWFDSFDKKDPGLTGKVRWYADECDLAGWKDANLPATLRALGANSKGTFWFRKTFDVPEDWSKKDIKLGLCVIDEVDKTWVNGQLVGSKDTAYYKREYVLKAGTVRPGTNTLTVRVLNATGDGGFAGQPDDMFLACPRGEKTTVSLAGAWKWREGWQTARPAARPVDPASPHMPATLFNGMVAPVIPFAIKGAIWYQGENNAPRAFEYADLFCTMIKDWRRAWQLGDIPFLFCQLANYDASRMNVPDYAWPELREAQNSALSLPKVGMAVTIDIGNPNDIHPTNKQEVGRRLQLAARSVAYDESLVYSGPIYRAGSLKIEKNKATVSFDHVGGGLAIQTGKELKGFEVAGNDRRFRPAEAEIAGNMVIVLCHEIAEPVAVRYGWSNSPVCTLKNKEGLPASPFRTDDWPKLTAENQ